MKIFEDESATTYTDSWCKEKQEKAFMNFELNIKLFKSLNYKDFNSKLNNFLKKNKNLKK